MLINRKTFLAATLLTMSMPLTGCLKKSQKEKSDESDGWGLTIETSEEWCSAVKNGQLKITVTDLRISKQCEDLGDETILVIFYDFKNGSNKYANSSAWEAFEVLQNGAKLNYWGITADGYTSAHGGENVEPGAKVSDYLVYELKDLSPVTVKLAGETVADNVSPSSLPHTS